MLISSEQIRAARMFLHWDQADLARASGVSLPTLKRLERKPGPLSAHAKTVEALRSALEAAGVEFPNSDQPGVRMKPYKLKDAGKNAFLIGPVAKWVGFGAVDAGRVITVQVEDIALERLDPSISGGAGYLSALEANRGRIFVIAQRKYERGSIEPDGCSVSVTYADVAEEV